MLLLDVEEDTDVSLSLSEFDVHLFLSDVAVVVVVV